MPKTQNLADEIEWFVMQEAGKPTKIIMGRSNAVIIFSHNFKLSQQEQHHLGAVLEKGLAIGKTVLLVGYEPKKEFPDRILTRVPAPIYSGEVL